MVAVFEFVAVLSCMLFAGAAIYINLVEHPARMEGETKIAAIVWAPSYKRATVMQAPLAILSFLAGVRVWLLGGGMTWLVGAVLIGLVVPFTFIAIMPTNHQLLAPGRAILRRRRLECCWRSGVGFTRCAAF
jgi:Anthrone oxygenase